MSNGRNGYGGSRWVDPADAIDTLHADAFVKTVDRAFAGWESASATGPNGVRWAPEGFGPGSDAMNLFDGGLLGQTRHPLLTDPNLGTSEQGKQAWQNYYDEPLPRQPTASQEASRVAYYTDPSPDGAMREVGSGGGTRLTGENAQRIGDLLSDPGLRDDSSSSSGVDHEDPWGGAFVAALAGVLAAGGGNGSGDLRTGSADDLHDWLVGASGVPASPGTGGTDKPEDENLRHVVAPGRVTIRGPGGGVVDPGGEQGASAGSPVRMRVAGLPDYHALLDEQAHRQVVVGPGTGLGGDNNPYDATAHLVAK